MTASLLEFEVADFVGAARWTHDRVGDAVVAAQNRLVSGLGGSFAMAGSDPGGLSWAAAYDRAAESALGALNDLAGGAYTVARMCAQTAMNYEAADRASAASLRHALEAQVSLLPAPSWSGPPPSLPTAAGGSGSAPNGWGLIEHAVGYIWPNGHQDRLHQAARAWQGSAAALRAVAADVLFPTVLFADDRLPELDDIRTVLTAMQRRTEALAEVHAAMARGCLELARHIDEAHSQVEGELVSLLEWTAGIEAGGALLSLFTFGGSEALAQGVEAGRIAKTAAAVAAILGRFTAVARTAAASVAALTERADLIAAELAGLKDVRLTYAVVQMAKAWPAKLRLDRSVGGLLAVAGPAEVGLEAGQAVLDGLGVSRLQIAEMAAEARLAVTADESDLTFTYFADRTAAREALRGDLAKASNQFFRGATSKSRDYRLAVQADGSYRMEFFSPANSPGYGKLYVQVVGGDGRVMMEYKDTLGPEGLIERKWIRGGP